MSACNLGTPGCSVRTEGGRHSHPYRPPAHQRWRCYDCRTERWSIRFGGPVPPVVSCAKCGRKSNVLTEGEKLALMLGKPPGIGIDDWKAEVSRTPLPSWMTGEHPRGTYHLEVTTARGNLYDLYFTDISDRTAFTTETERLFAETRECNDTDHPGRAVLADNGIPF
jgi:hypothetical protein